MCAPSLSRHSTSDLLYLPAKWAMEYLPARAQTYGDRARFVLVAVARIATFSVWCPGSGFVWKWQWSASGSEVQLCRHGYDALYWRCLVSGACTAGHQVYSPWYKTHAGVCKYTTITGEPGYNETGCSVNLAIPKDFFSTFSIYEYNPPWL